LVKTTDQAFTAVTSSGPIARFLRLYAVPAVLPLLFLFGPMRRLLYRTVSQTDVNYRRSQSSAGQVGSVHAGDRLPWVKIMDADNFAPLTALDWQVHVYGEATNELRKICADRVLPLHVLSWRDDMARAGLSRNALYLLRPDGYIAVAEFQSQATRIADYLDAHHIASRAAPAVVA
jgi:hypothetical protein